MKSAEVVDALARLDAAGVPVWLDGGWGAGFPTGWPASAMPFEAWSAS